MTRLAWYLLALIHVLPGIAFVRPALISTLYGVELASGAALLLQHRAALFLTVAVVCVWAAFRPETRQLAVVVVGLSMVTFLILFLVGGAPSSLRFVAIVDTVGLLPFAVVAWQAFGKS